MLNKINVVLVYARKDKLYKDELKSHFSAIIDKVNVWDDREIPPSALWDEVIKEKLKAADIILMLVSANFFNSEYIRSTEFRIAQERHIEKKALVLSIIIRDSAWEKTEIGKFQLLSEVPVAGQREKQRDKIYAKIVNDFVTIVENLPLYLPDQTVDEPVPSEEQKENCPCENEFGGCEIPLPYNKVVKVDSTFFVKVMPYFAKQLQIFTQRSVRIIDDKRKSYEGDPSLDSAQKLQKLQEFLQQLCREVNEVFFTHGGVRTHFRYLNTNKMQYLKLAAAMSGDYDSNYAMSPMPGEGLSMISKAAELKTPLIYSLNREWHHGPDPVDRPFKDYITFVLMDTAFIYQGKFLLSMGISFERPDVHKKLYYLLTLCRFDDIVSGIVKSFADALEIDVVNIILNNKDLVLKNKMKF